VVALGSWEVRNPEISGENHAEIWKEEHSLGSVLVWLRPATKAPCGRPSPLPGCRGEWKETGRNWWVRIRVV